MIPSAFRDFPSVPATTPTVCLLNSPHKLVKEAVWEKKQR